MTSQSPLIGAVFLTQIMSSGEEYERRMVSIPSNRGSVSDPRVDLGDGLFVACLNPL
ncbi:hypothetical protein MTBBW1_1350001 [Desulfamplus magnetovallimortis]|uniref:Uncharacterized protein n=1 Tax=Desulfamplus magnetovallimortis TaxID=1246637 RepID=A0A1W1H7U0_9BACT|nr:hypothetical protein MTBBW1_1350001 [Desulfamplus magnetovallimortis]